jgi:DHA2 family multidrug resistance protein
MITTGMLLFMLFSWQMSRLSLDANAADITISLIWRAIGLAVITVPLASLAVSSLEPKDIPQGAALNNMMRQLGGSFGLAIVNTYLTQRNAVHRSDLVANITTESPLAVKRLSDYTNFFVSKGAGLLEAKGRALKLMDLNVTKQSSLMSFDDAYLLIGLVFLISLPILLLASKRKGKQVQVVLSDH